MYNTEIVFFVVSFAAKTVSDFSCDLFTNQAIFIVIFCGTTRQPRVDISVIVDTFGIWKQAWQRRRLVMYSYFSGVPILYSSSMIIHMNVSRVQRLCKNFVFYNFTIHN